MIRRSLTACAVVLLAFTTACSDSVTGPSAKRRSGYITASSSVSSNGNSTGATTSGAPRSDKKGGTKNGGPVKPPAVEPQSSGYNVTAF